jgi:hypothetical protein
LKKKFLVILILFIFTFLARTSLFAETVKGDINNNGVKDLTAFFNSEALSKVELDRNEDGKIDAWFFFSIKADPWDTRADYDEDFDGRIDEIYFIKNDEPVKSLKDQDLDGLLDWETIYDNGNPSGNRRISPPLDPKSFPTNL